jgi:tetratricopeptide (TPR) repeat protein
VGQELLLDDLLDDVTKGTALLIAGSGVSIQASGDQPCASWEGLILDGIEHCAQTNLLDTPEADLLRRQLKGKRVGELLQVAEKVSETLGAPEGGEFRRWLQQSVGRLELRHREVIDVIHDLGVPLATTNYDDFLTRDRGIEAVPWTDGPAAHEIIRGDRPGVLHFHGYYDDPRSVVLGISSYQKLLKSAGAQAIQQAVVASRTLLFVGCGDGLSDPNFGALLKWSAKVFGTSIYRHYCLCRESERAELQKRYPPGKRLSYLEYGKDYSDLVPFLRDMLGSPLRARRPRSFAAIPPPGYCIGRESEVKEVVAALLEERPQPLPLLGGPGMGKTTIALTALHETRVATRFGARRWFVRCDGVKSRTELTAAIATALGLPITPAVEQAVMTSLAGAAGVLVIDNAETPLDADHDAVEELLAIVAAIESLALIVTIRGKKRPRGVPWRASLEAQRLHENAARDVFLAVSGNSKFATDPYLDRLLEALDGVALAITLMGRYAEVFNSLEPVWSAWDGKRTAMLHDGEQPSRETDIAVSYELSIGVLSGAARRLLTVLAMLPNGVALMDLDSVFAGSGEPARELRARALVFEEAKRLRMLAPLREYVLAAHPPDPSDAQLAVDHYLGLAQHEGNRVGAAGGAEAVARLAPEVANVESMLARTAVARTSVPVSMAVVGWAEMMRFTGLGSMSVIEEIARRTLESGMTEEAAACIQSLGNIALARSDHETARKRYEEALPLYQKVGDLLGEANCIRSLGDIALERSDHETARKRYEEALPLYQKVGSLQGEANCIKSLGHIALARSDHETARKRYEEALPLYQKVGALLGEANCIKSLGNIALARSDHETARKRYEEALPLYRKVGSLRGAANCIQSLGDIALARSDHETARKRYEEALQLYQKVGSLLGEANCIKSLGHIARAHSDHETARKRYEEALPLYRKVGDLQGEANCIKSLGDIALARADHETARNRYEEALPLYQKVGDLQGEANCIMRLGDIALRRSDHETARKRYEEALPRYQKIGSLLGEANCIKSLGDIALARSDHETARKRYEEALPLYQRVGSLQGEANCIVGLGDIDLNVGNRGEAEERYLTALALFERLPEPNSIGIARYRLARLASNETARREHVAAARAAWQSIGRDDLIEELDAEFGAA